MKTVKFKDLPEKVQRFINRVHGFEYDKNDDIILDSVHTASEWSKATDEERLAYAEWKYPKGTKITCIYNPSHYGFVEFHKLNSQGWIYSCGGSVPNIARYIYARGKWASIISEPEKEDFEMNASIKRDVEQVLAEDSEPTFKAGEYVEGRMKNWQEDVWTGEKLIYTGAKTKSGLFICEYVDGEVACFIEIKKIDPDKKYKDAAREIMAKEGIDYLGQYTHVGISPGKFESMLIEALKKGKEL